MSAGEPFARSCRGLVRAVWLLSTAILTGCATAPRSLYDWGDYEDSLYRRYTQQDFAKAEAAVYRMLPQVDGRGRVPPGVYADYGFLLYRRGELAAAVRYFGKEKAAYPESTLLMDKLIARIGQRGDPAAAKRPGEGSGPDAGSVGSGSTGQAAESGGAGPQP